jgi:hypothetical protein
MTLQLRVEFRAVDGASALHEGWRGLVDFGEHWTDHDADLWPTSSGAIPVGKPLVYGCELRLLASSSGERVAEGEGVLDLWSLDTLRHVMEPGACVRLLDGRSVRATGKLL